MYFAKKSLFGEKIARGARAPVASYRITPCGAGKFYCGLRFFIEKLFSPVRRGR
jgi:hypothetical protein